MKSPGPFDTWLAVLHNALRVVGEHDPEEAIRLAQQVDAVVMGGYAPKDDEEMEERLVAALRPVRDALMRYGITSVASYGAVLNATPAPGVERVH